MKANFRSETIAPMAEFEHEDGDQYRQRIEVIQIWIGKALEGFTSFSKRNVASATSGIAFGRCKVKEENATSQLKKSLLSKEKLNRLMKLCKIIGTQHELNDSSSVRLSQTQGVNVRTSLLSPQDNKHRGRQISNTKYDLKKASEKRKRQIQYSKEIQASLQDKSLDNDSIFRVVVKSFSKLMDCERCSLFWLDHSSHELYLKPVGDESVNGEIRFPASVGIAGWVATMKKMINVSDAYQNSSFNKDVDILTNFRTRSVLCAPVLVDGTVYAVVQMLNKFKDVPCSPELTRSSRKGGLTETRKYISFSVQDEELLNQCCEEVTKSVKGSKVIAKLNDATVNSDASDLSQWEKDAICNHAFEDMKGSRKGSIGRRGSIGTLMKFVHDMAKPDQQPECIVPVNEAAAKFTFRSEDRSEDSRRRSVGRRGSLTFAHNTTQPSQRPQPDVPISEADAKSLLLDPDILHSVPLAEGQI